MSDHSKIEWTSTRHADGTVTPGATWNPIRGIDPNRWMCQKLSPGCDNCYANTMNHRWGGSEYSRNEAVDVRLDERALNLPLSWKQPRRVFVCSMTDLFGEWVPLQWIEAVFRIMASAPQHQFQVLTKRAGRMAELTPKVYDRIYGWTDKLPLPNVWMGVSIELDRYAWRADYLRDTPAAVRFISAEPLSGRPLKAPTSARAPMMGIHHPLCRSLSQAGRSIRTSDRTAC